MLRQLLVSGMVRTMRPSILTFGPPIRFFSTKKPAISLAAKYKGGAGPGHGKTGQEIAEKRAALEQEKAGEPQESAMDNWKRRMALINTGKLDPLKVGFCLFLVLFLSVLFLMYDVREEFRKEFAKSFGPGYDPVLTRIKVGINLGDPKFMANDPDGRQYAFEQQELAEFRAEKARKEKAEAEEYEEIEDDSPSLAAEMYRAASLYVSNKRAPEPQPDAKLAVPATPEENTVAEPKRWKK